MSAVLDDKVWCARRRAYLRLIAVLVALPALCAYAWLAYATLTHRQLLVRTGDTLLDAYLQAVVDNDRVTNPGAFYAWNSQLIYSPGDTFQLPEQEWYSLEQRFGDDPRFWMLCYNLRREPSEYVSPVAGVEVYGRTKYLEQARQRGAVDWTVLSWLTLHYSNAWMRDAQKALCLSSPSLKSPPQAGFDYYCQLNTEITKRHGTVRQQLLGELLRAGADQAQTHYQLAKYAYDMGNPQGALRELAAGNAAPNNSAGIGAPFDALIKSASQNQTLAGDRLLTGSLAQLWSALPQTDLTHMRRMSQYLAQVANERHDVAARRTVHLFNCRYGSADGAPTLQRMLAVITARGLWTTLEQAGPLTAAQKQEQSTTTALAARLLTAIRGAATGPGLPPVGPAPWLKQLQALPATAGGGREEAMVQLDFACTGLLIEQSGLAATTPQLYQQLEQAGPWH